MGVSRYRLCEIDRQVRITALCSAWVGIKEAGYSFDGESHDFWECVFILRGRAGVTAGEDVYSLSRGDMIFHPPGEFHRLWNDGSESMRVLIISFSADVFPISAHRICRCEYEKRMCEAIRMIRKSFVTDGIFYTRF